MLRFTKYPDPFSDYCSGTVEKVMSETIRIWKESGLRFLYRPAALPLQHTSLSLSHCMNEPGEHLPASSHFFDIRFSLPLQEYWQRIQHPCSVIITYFNLDDDFHGSPNRQRLDLLRSIIKAKSWPLKLVAFWPPILHGLDAPSPAASMASFQELVDILDPRYILCFGNAAQQLFFDYLPQFSNTSSTSQSTRLILLPGLEDMLPDNKLVKKETWEIIRALTI